MILLNLESTELMLLMWCSPLRTYWRGHTWGYSNITAERHHQSLWLLNCSWVPLKFKGWIWHGVSLDSHSYKLRKTPTPRFSHRNIINKSVTGLPWLLSLWISWKLHTYTRKKYLAEISSSVLYKFHCFLQKVLEPPEEPDSEIFSKKSGPGPLVIWLNSKLLELSGPVRLFNLNTSCEE